MADLHDIFADEIKIALLNPAKSTSRRIRDLRGCIETALSEGFKHKDVFAYLNRSGLAVAWTTYDSALARARARDKAKVQPLRKGNIASPLISNPVPGQVSNPIQNNSKGPVLPPKREDPGLITDTRPIEF